MDPSVALVVLVTAADADAGGTPAAVGAITRALGTRGVVQVLKIAPDSTLADSAVGADAVVVLHWEEGGRRAHLRVRARPRAEWIERDLGFDARDAESERGRAVGLAIVSMLPEVLEAPPPAPPPKAPAPPVPPARPALPAPPSASPGPAPKPVGEIQLKAQLALAPGGAGGGVGGTLEGQLFFGRVAGLHASFGLRGADAPEAEGSASYLRAGGGVGLRVRVSRTTELGTTLDVVVLRDSIRHFSTDGDDLVPVTRARALPGLRGDLRASWFFTSNAALGLSVGAEVAFGTTGVFLHERQVTTIVPVRLVLEPGLLVRF